MGSQPFELHHFLSETHGPIFLKTPLEERGRDNFKLNSIHELTLPLLTAAIDDEDGETFPFRAKLAWS